MALPLLQIVLLFSHNFPNTFFSANYQDPTINAPGEYLQSSFFITFYENSTELHIPPNGTFVEVEVTSTQDAYLFYFSDNKWTKSCFDPIIISETSMFVELCHATQYAIFKLKIDSSTSSSTTDATIIAVVVVVLVIVIGGLTGALIYYRKKILVNFKDKQWLILLQKLRYNRTSEVEMSSLSMIKDVTVQHKLGAGNFGEVYKGEWKVNIRKRHLS